MYLIRWTKDPNHAKPGEWATNESYYPEDWIFSKADIPTHQLPGNGVQTSLCECLLFFFACFVCWSLLASLAVLLKFTYILMHMCFGMVL